MLTGKRHEIWATMHPYFSILIQITKYGSQIVFILIYTYLPSLTKGGVGGVEPPGGDNNSNQLF